MSGFASSSQGGGGAAAKDVNWKVPQTYCFTPDALATACPLMLMNSLTRNKDRFIPKDPKQVTWYQCGPTVYADSHIGHARTYISLDIIRRIMKEYLGYNIILCQNITDIDDKIIIKSSQSNEDFRDLAARNEASFFRDMADLGVAHPDIVTRVSEYVPEILDFISNLIKNGFAYESNGSVYFDTKAFQQAGHTYGKLMPEQIGNSDLLAEGEGALSEKEDPKRSASDFALWKKTKDHTDGTKEPFWESPWGKGRPGWHIECSAMSLNAMKTYSADGCFDVHAGGIDLKFPHHENEIAQSEGHCRCDQWVNYWLHTGHLNIQGLKMSKSLKNFITIKEALGKFSAKQLRMCFLLHKYNAPMDYNDQIMEHAVITERKFSEFSHNVKSVLRRHGITGRQKVEAKDEILMKKLEEVKESVRAAIHDDFDTPRIVTYLEELVRECNKYVEDQGNAVNTTILLQAAKFVLWIFKIFGFTTDSSDIGFMSDTSSESGASKEALLGPYLDVLAKYRETVRLAAIRGDTAAILKATDDLRDLQLPELGVRMEDKGSGKDAYTIWKLDDPEVLKKERELKEEARLEKEAKQKADQEAKQKAKDEKARVAAIPPEQYFAVMYPDQFSAFDEEGVPSHDKAGVPLSKSKVKDLKKEFTKHKENYTAATTKANP